MNYFLFTKQSVQIPLMQQRKVCESAHPMKAWSHAYCDHALDFTSSNQNYTLCTWRRLKCKEIVLYLQDHRVRQQLEGSRGDVLTALKSFQASPFTHGCDWTSDIKQLGEERLWFTAWGLIHPGKMWQAARSVFSCGSRGVMLIVVFLVDQEPERTGCEARSNSSNLLPPARSHMSKDPLPPETLSLAGDQVLHSISWTLWGIFYTQTITTWWNQMIRDHSVNILPPWK